MVLLSAQPFELMMLMTMVLVVMVELMKVTNSDDDDVEWNKARALAEPGQGSCISGGGLITPSRSGGLNFNDAVGVSISSKRFPEANLKT